MKNRLESRVAAAVLAGILCLQIGAAQAQSPYSLKTVEANPVPRQELFNLWREVALQQCANAPARHNITRERCASLVNERAPACVSKVSGSAPAVVRTTAASKDAGRQYLQCVTPHYFCKGVEVQTEAEVRAQCR